MWALRDRSLQGIYLGCACDSTTGVFQHLFTDGKTIYVTAHGLHVVPVAYPLTVKIRNNATFGYIEDINDENEEEDQPFDAKTLVSIVTEALAEKERDVQMYLAYRRDDGDAQQAKQSRLEEDKLDMTPVEGVVEHTINRRSFLG